MAKQRKPGSGILGEIVRGLAFSRNEQRGILVLSMLILLVNVVRWLLPGSVSVSAEEIGTLDQEMQFFRESLQSDSAARNQTQYFSEQKILIELNSADTFDLQRLRGIGPAFARRITWYREKLGGFVAKKQLLEIWGMNRERYDDIRDHIMVDPTRITKIPINAASFKSLMYHPYISFEIAREIAILRKERRGIKTLQEIRELAHMDSLTFAKLVPYISLE